MGKLINFMKDWKNQSHYFKWLVSYSKPYLPQIMLIMIFQLSVSSVSVIMAVLSKKIIDSASKGNILIWAISVYLVVMMLNTCISVVTDLFGVLINEKFAFGIRKQIYDKIIHSQWIDVTKFHTGDLLTRLTTDAIAISEGIVEIFPSILKLGFELLITFFTLYYYEPKLAIFALLIAPVSAIVSFSLGRKIKRIQQKVQESEANYRSFMQESLSNLVIIKSFTYEEASIDELTDLRNERLYWIKRKNNITMLSSLALSLTFQIGYVSAFAIGAIQLAKNQITYGTISVFLTLVNRVQSPVLKLAETVPKVVSVLASAGRIIELQNIPLEEKSVNDIVPNQVGLRVQNLIFGYGKEVILKDITFHVRPSEFVAIVGNSGIGKTTLIKLIMSFLNTENGQIEFYDSIGNKEAASCKAREFISYVPQGNTLFSGSIQKNILIGNPDATTDQLWAAIEAASASEFIKKLPQGIETVIGERGHGLSEGQAQRIAIARALIKNAPMLILDEATSALDEATELFVISRIKALPSKPTCLIITHRKSILQYCDRELKLTNHKIQEIELS